MIIILRLQQQTSCSILFQPSRGRRDRGNHSQLRLPSRVFEAHSHSSGRGSHRPSGPPPQAPKGWRILKISIKDTWARYGFYEADGSEAFNLVVEENADPQL
jgi:hypothetical protein